MAWNLLMTSDIGLLSLFTILFVIGMGFFFYNFFQTNAAADALRAQGKEPGGRAH